MKNNDNKFILGECDENGKKYKFKYINKKYEIVELEEESEKSLLSTNEAKAAYDSWNEIKRPEKRKKIR